MFRRGEVGARETASDANNLTAVDMSKACNTSATENLLPPHRRQIHPLP